MASALCHTDLTLYNQLSPGTQCCAETCQCNHAQSLDHYDYCYYYYYDDDYDYCYDADDVYYAHYVCDYYVYCLLSSVFMLLSTLYFLHPTSSSTSTPTPASASVALT